MENKELLMRILDTYNDYAVCSGNLTEERVKFEHNGEVYEVFAEDMAEIKEIIERFEKLEKYERVMIPSIRSVIDQLAEKEKQDKVKLMLKQKECVLRYVASEDCFAVRCILDDKWYKLTDDLIKNNIREEVKPTPLIDKVKELKEKVKKQDKILEILKPRIYIEEGLYREDYQDDRLKFDKDFFDSVEQENTIKEWLDNGKD